MGIGSILVIGSLIAFLIGMASPKTVLLTSKTPTRPKVAILTIGLFFVGVFIVAAVAPPDQSPPPKRVALNDTAPSPQIAKPTSIKNAEMALLATASSDGFIVAGRTNLPQGTQMIVDVSRAGGYLAQNDATVGEFGRFYAGPYVDNGNALAPGTYEIEVTAAITAVQPREVEAAAGHGWSNYLGPLVDKSGQIGPVINMKWKIHWDPPGDPTYTLATQAPKHSKMQLPDETWVLASIANRVRAKNEAWQSHREDAFFMCQVLIKKNLRDPDSASFLNDYSPDLVVREGDEGYKVLQRVRANNGFGGKTVSIFSCTTHPDGDSWRLDDVKEIDD